MSLLLLGAGPGALSAAPPAGPPTMVLNNYQPASGASPTLVPAANTIADVPAGTFVAVWIDDAFREPDLVEDTAGNSYAKLGAQNHAPSGQFNNLYGAFITHPIVAGSTQFKINNPDSTAKPIINAFQVPSAIALDLGSAGDNAGSSGTSNTFALDIPATNNASEIAIASLYSNHLMPPATPPADWTCFYISGPDFAVAHYWKNLSTTDPDTSFAGSFSGIPSGGWAVQFVTLTR